MAVFAAIRGQHLCVPDLSLLQERGGNFRGKRDNFWESRADPWPCRVGRALPAREEHVPAPRSKPRGATNAENQSRWLNGVGHSSPRAGGSRPPGYGYNTLVPLPSHPALTTRAKHPSGIYGWMVDQTQAGPFQVSRANSQWIHFSMKYFCGNHVLGNHKSSFLKAAWSLYPLSN